MKTRETFYKDYGFEENEDKKLKAYCRSPNFSEQILLHHCALSSNPSLADDLYYSIINKLSYEELSKIKYIPSPKSDFYGYQRKCLRNFRDLLILHGKWK